MNLIALQFGVFLRRRQANDSTGRVHFLSQLETLLKRVTKKFLKHAHDVLVRMIIVIPQGYVVSRLLFWPWRLGFGSPSRLGDDCLLRHSTSSAPVR